MGGGFFGIAFQAPRGSFRNSDQSACRSGLVRRYWSSRSIRRTPHLHEVAFPHRGRRLVSLDGTFSEPLGCDAAGDLERGSDGASVPALTRAPPSLRTTGQAGAGPTDIVAAR